uniref:Uncharacterized protein n=2 Tax=Aegilops tauschii TaxID=37682 RepID=A0A453QY47_AEGTS
MLIDLGNDNDIFGKALESITSATSVPTADLASIDQLLETVRRYQEDEYSFV